MKNSFNKPFLYEYEEAYILILAHFFFVVDIVGAWVQLGPLGTVATNRPIVPWLMLLVFILMCVNTHKYNRVKRFIYMQ
jgi:hypothetical protein